MVLSQNSGAIKVSAEHAWLPTPKYNLKFPPGFPDNGLVSEGHKEFTFQNVDGILWPDTQEVKFRF